MNTEGITDKTRSTQRNDQEMVRKTGAGVRKQTLLLRKILQTVLHINQSINQSFSHVCFKLFDSYEGKNRTNKKERRKNYRKVTLHMRNHLFISGYGDL